jgi:hypothetical protein
MSNERDPQLTVPFAMLVPLVVAMALVGVRGELDPEVTALVLALTVVAGGRLGGRAGGVASALMAAASFDFFHTRPYLSLKMTNGKDIATTLLLLVAGLAVGGLAARARRRQPSAESTRASGASALTRVLEVAAKGCAEDVELSVRAELLELLHLRDCWFTTDGVTYALLDGAGTVRVSETVGVGGDGPLPADGVALPVTWSSRRFGYLVAMPLPGAIVAATSRRIAVAMAEVLGLAFAAEPAAA